MSIFITALTHTGSCSLAAAPLLLESSYHCPSYLNPVWVRHSKSSALVCEQRGHN